MESIRKQETVILDWSSLLDARKAMIFMVEAQGYKRSDPGSSFWLKGKDWIHFRTRPDTGLRISVNGVIHNIAKRDT